MLFRETVALYCENRTEHTGTLCVGRIYSNSVRTSHETHHFTATVATRLMLFREIVAVYCENRTEHTGTLCVASIYINSVRTSQ
jgi:hypothetical protein